MGVADFINANAKRLLADIQIIRVFLHKTGNSTEVVFEMFVGGKTVARLITSPREMNLPLSYEEMQARFENPPDGVNIFKIPDYILSGLQYVFGRTGDSSVPIWLSLVLPYGYLPMVPWEALLQRAFQTPLLRLPHQPLKPLMPSESLDVILCIAQSPGSTFEELASKLDSQLLPRTRRVTRLYIFGSKELQPLLRSVKRFESSRLSVDNFDPEAAPDYKEARGEGSRVLQNPWLIWMQRAMAGKSADLAHLIVHGSISGEQSFLQFPPSPLKGVDANWGSYVEVEELSLFLNHVGCWSTGFSAPADPYSAGALRTFQESLAYVRPGPIFVHEGSADPGYSGLAATLEFLYGLQNTSPPASPALSLFCHPSGTERSFFAGAFALLPASLRTNRLVSQLLNRMVSLSPMVKRGLDILNSNEAVREVLNDYTLASKASAALQGRENTPAWLAAAQRILEQSVSVLYGRPIDRVLEEGETAPKEVGQSMSQDHAAETAESASNAAREVKYKSVGNDVRQGTEEALRIVAEVVASHAERLATKGS